MVLIHTTCENPEEAKKLGRVVIQNHLASSVSMLPVESIYEWNGKLEEKAEVEVYIKTNESKMQEIEDIVLRSHTYSTPFVGVFEAKRLNRGYREWMSQVIK